MEIRVKTRKCRNCKKLYVVPGIKPGCCSILCYKVRHKLRLSSSKRTSSNSIKLFMKSDDWKLLRFSVLRKYGYKCMACHKKNTELHVDHIKPVSIYPELARDINNLQVLCKDCNIGKSNLYEDDLRPLPPSNQA